jgi:hypothetical protein
LRLCSSIGSVKVKRLPRPRTLSTQIRRGRIFADRGMEVFMELSGFGVLLEPLNREGIEDTLTRLPSFR